MQEERRKVGGTPWLDGVSSVVRCKCMPHPVRIGGVYIPHAGEDIFRMVSKILILARREILAGS